MTMINYIVISSIVYTCEMQINLQNARNVVVSHSVVNENIKINNGYLESSRDTF